MSKLAAESKKWGKRLVAAGLAATIGYLGIARLIDNVTDVHVPTPLESKTKTSEGLATIIARELQKQKRFQGDTKPYLITDELVKTRTVKFLGKVIGEDVNRGTIVTTGSAHGVVEFEGITADSGITVAPDNSSVTIHVPPAHLADVSASHEAGVVHFFYDPNGPCKADQKIGQCPKITETELLQRADKKVIETANADPAILPTAEQQAEDFLSGLINGVGLALLRNQDPTKAPSHINVQLAFDAVAGPASYQPDIQRKAA